MVLVVVGKEAVAKMAVDLAWLGANLLGATQVVAAMVARVVAVATECPFWHGLDSVLCSDHGCHHVWVCEVNC